MKKPFVTLRQAERHIKAPIRVYPNRQAVDFAAHWHLQYEIILPVEEGYAVVAEGKRFDLNPGDILIIPSGVAHALFAPETGFRYVIMVDQEIIRAMEGFSVAQHLFYPCALLRAGDDRVAAEYLWQIVREKTGNGPMMQDAIISWMRLFLVRTARGLLRASADKRRERGQQMVESFLDVYDYITVHCSEKLTLEEVAAYSGYSKYHFSRMFKEYTGMSFYEFYLRQRILLCRRLLGEAALPITEVASRAGFGSLATFNRVFKQYEGVTPTRYRQNLHEAALSDEGQKTK